MTKISCYKPNNTMSELINDNCSLLMVMSRFGISLGFGNKTVKEICNLQNVDCDTFLSVANFISGYDFDVSKISLASLISYLKRAHTYFLDFNLPRIRRKLIEAIDCSGSDDVAFLILKFYDEYVTEVKRHMEHENDTVFKYVEALIGGNQLSGYSIATFASKHNHINSKLNELKDIIIRYYPEKENDLLNSVLFDIINCEQDLLSHCAVEDKIFVPTVAEMEKNLNADSNNDSPNLTQQDIASGEKLEILSQREKEIIECVAKGMSNKAIADTLCLSINTVTTHRRNISAKLDIHTPAGLTIFAIVNKLVRINEIKIS